MSEWSQTDVAPSPQSVIVLDVLVTVTRSDRPSTVSTML